MRKRIILKGRPSTPVARTRRCPRSEPPRARARTLQPIVQMAGTAAATEREVLE